MNKQQLPPLPDPARTVVYNEPNKSKGYIFYAYTADHMHAQYRKGYEDARAALAAQGAPADLCERICAAIKAADDKSTDEAGYMLDSDDCIAIVREQFAAAPAPEAKAVPITPEQINELRDRVNTLACLSNRAERNALGSAIKAALSSLLDGAAPAPEAKAAAAPAQAQQAEAVAFYVYEWANLSDCSVFRSLRYDEREFGRPPDKVYAVPLGATKAKAKPLTSEQTKALMRQAGYDKAHAQAKADFINGLRHGERARGIGASSGEKSDA